MGNIPVNTTYNTYLFGDFDRDGVKNVDDYKPFNHRVRTPPQTTQYYHHAQFLGGEILMSSELMAWKAYNESHRQGLMKVMKENPHSFGRIKTVPSTMLKLRTRNISTVGDIAGVTILTQNRRQAYSREKNIRRRYEVSSRDDYYSQPKNDVYYALHNTLNIRGKQIEMQIKSKKMYQIGVKMHYDYKLGNDLFKYKALTKRLYNQGY